MKRGYTLIELLTGISIFILVVGTVTSLLISAISAQRRALALREIIDSSSYAIDYMSRALRVAKKDDIVIGGQSKDCSGVPNDKKNFIVSLDGRSIKFRTYKLIECQEFYWDSTAKRIKENKNGQVNDLTPAELEVTTLKFTVIGDSPGDTLQPRVTIFMEIQKRGEPATKVSIQTSVSQRDLDL